MNEAEFDRALGAWEDSQLNAHLAKEEEWEDIAEKGLDIAWHMSLTEFYIFAPVTAVRDIESLAEKMGSHIADLIAEGKWNHG